MSGEIRYKVFCRDCFNRAKVEKPEQKFKLEDYEKWSYDDCIICLGEGTYTIFPGYTNNW